MTSISANDIGFILGILGVIGIIFTIYNYFRNPQIKQDKLDAILQERIKATNETNEIRFKNMNDSFNSLVLQTNNHIHTVEECVKNLETKVNSLTVGITKLSTIIEERIPKK